MNSFRIRLNSLTIIFPILLSQSIPLRLSCIEAQQLTEKNNITALYDSAVVYYRSSNYSNAVQNFNKILLLKSKISEDINPKYFKIYNLLGVIYKTQGDLNEAINFYKKALESTSDNYYLSLININLANIYSLKGDYSKAIYYFENTLAVLKKSDDKRKYGYIVNNYHNLGYSYYKLGNYNLAKASYLKSIQMAKENYLGENSETYYNCGLVYQKLDSLSKADYCFRKAIAYNLKKFGTNHYMTGMAYINYACFYSEIGQLTKSEQLYSKAYKILISTLGIKHSYTSLCLMNNGQLFYRKGDYKQALRYYQQSLISKIYSFNDNSIYTNPNADVLPDMDLLDILKLKAQAFGQLAEQENKTENLKAALVTLELATSFTERLRIGYLYEGSKLQLAEREHEVYLSIVRIANSLYEISGDSKYMCIAFRYAEYGKYAVLRELKNDEMAKDIAGVPDSISGSERSLKQQIASLRMQVEDESKLEHPNKSKIDLWNEQQFTLTQRLEGLMQRLESSYPEYYRQKYSNEVVSVTQLQKAMDKKEAVLEYVLGDKELYTFAITKDTFQLVRQEADTTFLRQLNFLIYAMRSFYSTGYYKYRDAAYTLYKKLIYPVEPLLKGKNLLIIPDGKLGLIPFDVLTDRPCQEGDRRDYVHEPYLLMKYPIGYAYSATLYSNSLNSTHKGSPNFLGIAPDYKNSKDSLRNIPIGLQSVRKIALLTLGKSLTGSNATEENFRKYSNSYGIIHFYAHGFEDTLNPANSKLVLSTPTDSTDDDYLHAWEVYNMQLNAEMVVLGSCFSGSGKLSEGEGVLSISRSFMYAGSKSVVMSLWAAADRSTNNILNDFYLNLLKGMRKDEALRLAKLKNLESVEPISAHPRYWAGIVVNGNQNGLYHYWYLKKITLAITVILTLLLVFWKRKAIKILLSADTSRSGDAGRS
ncbi:MAG: CHAT domain-containing protein [Bacteroidales bacterium]|nr:CHAT domain-containing protein [Bacteroidales bacterium]